mmetsp:Transcript_116675/g.330607  ORF Transcript_116675/g.330607 Transcript_116675/m.330607 type:complete len:215 (-) Transcript_116675:740-1384(-)
MFSMARTLTARNSMQCSMKTSSPHVFHFRDLLQPLTPSVYSLTASTEYTSSAPSIDGLRFFSDPSLRPFASPASASGFSSASAAPDFSPGFAVAFSVEFASAFSVEFAPAFSVELASEFNVEFSSGLAADSFPDFASAVSSDFASDLSSDFASESLSSDFAGATFFTGFLSYFSLQFLTYWAAFANVWGFRWTRSRSGSSTVSGSVLMVQSCFS